LLSGAQELGRTYSLASCYSEPSKRTHPSIRTNGYMLMATHIEAGDQLSKFIVYTRKAGDQL
uniref:Uncharacterized protein n=1 Tax=Aegilops tauschii subsp. strangulata TaxID=200361 RepID=A0A453HMM3_AEGTS